MDDPQSPDDETHELMPAHEPQAADSQSHPPMSPRSESNVLVARALAGDRQAQQKLLQNAVDGDKKAGVQLVRCLMPFAHSGIAAVLRRFQPLAPERAREETKDLVQDTLMVCVRDDWKTLRAWDPKGPASLFTYVRVVAGRRALDKVRKWNRRSWGATVAHDESRDGKPNTISDPETVILTKHELHALWSVLRSELNSTEWLIFIKYVLKVNEDLIIAELKGLSGVTLRKRVSRVRIKARRIADELLKDDNDS